MKPKFSVAPVHTEFGGAGTDPARTVGTTGIQLASIPRVRKASSAAVRGNLTIVVPHDTAASTPTTLPQIGLRCRYLPVGPAKEPRWLPASNWSKTLGDPFFPTNEAV